MLLNGTKVRFEESGLSVRLPPVVATSPIVKLNGPVVAPTLIVWFGMPVIVGASFTAVTVTTKFVLTTYCPSLTLTVIVAVPLWLVAGLTVTVRFAPDPPNTMLLVGTSVGYDEPLLNVRLPAAVSHPPP